MGVFDTLKNFLQLWNQSSDEYSDIMIQKEYRGFMHILGLYPNVKKVGLFWGCFRALLVGSLLLFHTVGLIVSAVMLYNINFIYFSTSLHYVLIVGIAFLYVWHFNTNRHYFARYHSRMYFNFYNYHEEITAEITDVIEKGEKQKIRFTILPLSAALAAVCVLLLAPILDKYGTFDFDIETSINFNLPLPMFYVFDSSTRAGYLLALTHQLSSAMLCGLVLGGTGYSFIVASATMAIQMRILINRLDTIESRAMALYEANYGPKKARNEYDLYSDEKFSKCMDICLRRCVEHHKVILSNISELKDFFSLPLFCIFFVAAMIIALALVGVNNWRVLPGNTIVSLMLCWVEIAFLAVVSSLGQTLTDLNEELRNSVYGIKWYHCKKGFCLNIRILLTKTLIPVTFTAFGLIKICHATFANIINSAYSYYNLASVTSS